MAEYFLPEEQLFEQVADVLNDPYVDRVMAQARIFERVINMEGATDDQLEAHVATLDSTWIYMDQPLTITGKVYFRKNPDMPPEPEMHKGLKVTSNGFIFSREAMYPTNDPDDVLLGKYRVAQIFWYQVDDETPRVGHAFLDDAIVDYPFPSPERRSKRLNHEHPEISSDIRNRIERMPRDDQSCVALKGFSIMANLATDEGREHREDVQAYLASHVPMEGKLPYMMVLDGVFRVGPGGPLVTHVPIANRLERTVYVSEIILLPDTFLDPKQSDSTRLVPYAVGIMFDNQSSVYGNDLSVMIPLTSISSIHSARYFGIPLQTIGPEHHG